jgi:CRP-like cAMP-binding protein
MTESQSDAAPPAGRDSESGRDPSDSSVMPAVDYGEAAITNIDLFSGLSPEELKRVHDVAQHREAINGEVVVAEWDTSSELYVILRGTAEVVIRGERIGELGPGDFFGEIAAFDWGAGESQSRAATVRATSYMHLLVIPAYELRPLMEQLPSLATRIRDAVRQLRPADG